MELRKNRRSGGRNRSRRFKTNNPADTNDSETKGNQEQRNSHAIQIPSPLLIALDQRSLEQIATAKADQSANKDTQTAAALASLTSSISGDLKNAVQELSKPKDKYKNSLLLLCNIVLAAIGFWQAYLAREALKASRDSLDVAREAQREAKLGATAADLRAERMTKANEALASAAREQAETALRRCDYNTAGTLDRIIVPPKSPRTVMTTWPNVISQREIDEIRDCNGAGNCKRYFQVCIKASYSTIGGNYPFERCAYYSPRVDTFIDCKN